MVFNPVHYAKSGQPVACMTQVTWASSVCGMQQIMQGVESRERGIKALKQGAGLIYGTSAKRLAPTTLCSA